MKKLEHNVSTGEVKLIPMTSAELEQKILDEQALLEKKLETDTAAATKSALLERLGLTADEAALLIS